VTATTDEEIALVRQHGADDVVDYRGDVAIAVQDKAGLVGGVLHLGGDVAQLARLVKPGGRLASTMDFSGDGTDAVAVRHPDLGAVGEGDVTFAKRTDSPSCSTEERRAKHGFRVLRSVRGARDHGDRADRESAFARGPPLWVQQHELRTARTRHGDTND
jgi:hypothetical protein